MAASDDFGNYSADMSFPARGGEAVTPNDSADLAKVSRAVYAGVGGDLAVVMADGTALTFSNFPAGSPIPIRVSRIKSTGTTATGIVALY